MEGRPIRELTPIAIVPVVLGVLLLTALFGPSGAVVGVTLVVIGGVLTTLGATRLDVRFIEQARTTRLRSIALTAEPAPAPGARSVPYDGPQPGSFSRRSYALPAIRIAGATDVVRWTTLALLGGMSLFFYLWHIGSNPVALFCDEAQLGLQAYRLFRGDAELGDIPLFVKNFQYNHVGSIPMLFTAPFVAVFGLDDFGVRLTSAVLTLVSLYVFYRALRLLQLPFPSVAVALFAFSPVVIHVGRINFGNAPSMLLIPLGFLFYIRARQEQSRKWAIWSGCSLGVGSYMFGPFYVYTPMLVGAIGLSELLFNARKLREWTTYAIMAGVTALWFMPLAYEALTEDNFFSRFNDKQESDTAFFSIDRVREMIDNYPKYFTLDYLFKVGEVGLPGGWISRHSVAGAGELSWIALPVLALAVVSVVRCWRHPMMRYLLPWVVFAAFYPLPDLLTTSLDRPPYTFSTVGATIALPFLCGLALLGLKSFAEAGWSVPRLGSTAASPRPESIQSPRFLGQPIILTLFAGLLLFGIVYSGLRFYTGPYQNYPKVSADYWGWQYGPREMINYYKAHTDEYDQFLMDGNYNEAFIFLDFYLAGSDLRNTASIGDLSRIDPAKRQLFGVRAEIWDEVADSRVPPKSYLEIVNIIYYPNGDAAAYLVRLKPGMFPDQAAPQAFRPGATSADSSWTSVEGSRFRSWFKKCAQALLCA